MTAWVSQLPSSQARWVTTTTRIGTGYGLGRDVINWSHHLGGCWLGCWLSWMLVLVMMVMSTNPIGVLRWHLGGVYWLDYLMGLSLVPIRDRDVGTGRDRAGAMVVEGR
jgi:hypothetical protein